MTAQGILCAAPGAFADLPAVEAAILQQVGALAAGDFSQQELDTARAGLLSDLRAMHDSPGRLDEFLTGRQRKTCRRTRTRWPRPCAASQKRMSAGRGRRDTRYRLYAGGGRMSWTDYPALGECCYFLDASERPCRARAPEAGLRGEIRVSRR